MLISKIPNIVIHIHPGSDSSTSSKPAAISTIPANRASLLPPRK